MSADNWEGPICRTCYDRAIRTWGRCPACHAERLLPGRQCDGTAICRDCAGITRDFVCTRCGTEGRLLGGRLCEHCTLTDKLTALLDDGTDKVRPELVLLFEGLRSTTRPKSTLTWLLNPHVPELLRGMATGQLPITHEALAECGNWRAASFMRELLMTHGVLPRVDKQLMLFERWLAQRLSTITDPGQAQLINRFATWSELHRLRAQARRQSVRPSTTTESRQRINRGLDFLNWLADRGTNLQDCAQVDIDAWHAEKYTSRRHAQPFLRWSMTAGHMPKVRLPRRATTNPAPLSQQRRLAMIRKLTTSTDIPLRERAAGLLVLFYAQPVSRLVRLTTNDVVVDHDSVRIRLGNPPAPAPEPLASLLRDLLAQRTSLQAPNAETNWLFPGRQPGHPLCARSLAGRLRHHDIAVQAGRTSALRHLVLQAPAPVVASMLGYHDKHTTRVLTEAGGTWNRYAGGEHSQ